MDKLLTVGEVAERLRVGRRTVIRWIVDGRLRGFKLKKFIK
jgi:excisionase family DNA binding protein